VGRHGKRQTEFPHHSVRSLGDPDQRELGSRHARSRTGNMRFPVLGLALLALSAAVLTVGAELFAEHAGAAARRVGVTALAVGLLVAGAEPEEMVTAAIASARHHPGIALGDALGANVTMLTLVLGSIAVLVGLPLSARVRGYAVGASLAVFCAPCSLRRERSGASRASF
jgi:Ca2+/Na+ antiporter